MHPLILNRSLKLVEQIYDESMYGNTDIYRIKDIIHSMDENQWKSKQWLVDVLKLQYGTPSGKILIIGGWYGLMGYLLRQAFPADQMHIVSVDMDPRCEEFGYKLFFDQDIEFVTGDVRDQTDIGDYSAIISTSTEHFYRPHLLEIIEAKSRDAWVCVQSNDYFDHPSHVNCSKHVDDVADYLLPVLPMKWIAYKGELSLPGYRRFLVMAK